jgi:methyltransferase (TIGR00027 family)
MLPESSTAGNAGFSDGGLLCHPRAMTDNVGLDERTARQDESMSENTAEPLIRTVSDTARWVAYYRAMETDRPDAIFRDPFARRLAGERGEQIVRTLRRGKASAWAMIVRTAVMDETILKMLAAESLPLVINLAAGLDARPYRLDLPPHLVWVEVDLPEMIQLKEQEMAGETPRCIVRRMGVDLGDAAARNRAFTELNDVAGQNLVITEGLIAYLTPEQVTGLAVDLHARDHFRYWLTDIAAPRVKEMMEKYWGKHLRAAQAPFRFAPKEGPEFFRPLGWEPAEFRDFLIESRRLNRRMPMDWMIQLQQRLFPRRAAREAARWRSGVVLLRRA